MLPRDARLTPTVLVTNIQMLLTGNSRVWGTPVVVLSQIKQSASAVTSHCWTLEKIYV